ncbi:hypothetical protein PRK78_001402 [Emydomyces testavorans]|uniref:Uncharacterized protein n=1 Tax=Emydomyces testavorans TaxID=2070801 RepID=A0AAF0DCM5_9EURO|nr:hypothetical protein PRK78_001402 [Emydomyces testavorans]
MFRRKRSASHGPINPNPSPSAQTAAAQAFRASQAANANAKLSSSAAAAALRRHTPTPTSIEDVQTKRMLQRQQSVSSIASPKGSIRRGQDATLRRASSMGPMSRRTFRDESPVFAGHMGPKEEIDPVPPLPQGYVTSATLHQRAVSGGATGRRSISPQIPSSAAQQPTSPSQWKSTRNVPVRSVQGRAMGSPSGVQRRNSKGSINFSYPINARPTSPRQPSITIIPTDTTSIRTLSPAESHTMDFASHTYVPKVEPTTEVTAQRKQTSSERPTSEDLPPMHTRGSGVKEEARRVLSEERNGRQSDSKSTSPHIPTSDYHLQSNSSRSRPSTFRESHAIDKRSSNRTLAREDPKHNNTAPVVEVSPTEGSKEVYEPERGGHTRNQASFPNTPCDSSSRPPLDRQIQPAGKGLTLALENHVQSERPPSVSPTRSTRFSEHLEIALPGEHLHEPPPRSKSPAKSALKPTAPNVTPDRLATPQLKTADAPSESDGTSVLSDEGSRLSWKKKLPKVSFEDETEVLGVTASPPTSPDSIVPSSPQFMWNDSLRSKCSHIDDLDEVMKPRPVLPSFGSIRGRRLAGEEEEHFRIRPEDSRPSLADSVFGDSFSNDFAIGELLASNSRQKTEIDRDQPLPPKVTSVEGTGFDSASVSESSTDEADPNDFVLPGHSISSRDEATRFNQQQNGSNKVASDSQKSNCKKTNFVVPVIAIQPATPMFEEYSKTSHDENHIPGAFPGAADQEENLDSDRTEQKGLNLQGVENGSSASKADDTDSESGDSIYIDAAENISDFEGDGFGSINAIVSGSPTETIRISKATCPTSFIASTVKPVHVASQPGVEAYSIEIQPQASNPPTSQKEPLPTTYDGRDLPERQFQPPLHHPSAKIREAKTNGTPNSGDIKVNRPVQELKAQKTPVATDSHHSVHVRSTATRNASLSKFKNPVETTVHQEMSSSSPSARRMGFASQKPIRAQSISYSSSTLQPLQRKTSNGSDSSSSFKRERRSRVDTGTYTLRRTMRSGFGHSKTESFNERKPAGMSASNSHQHRPFASGDGHVNLRTTLRGPGSISHVKSSSSPFSDIKRSKPASGNTREFGSGFQSRFADSSDDEYDVRKFTPVRGIPRRTDEVDGDSTALEDSSDSDSPRRITRKLHTRQYSSKRRDAPIINASTASKMSNKDVSAFVSGHLDPRFDYHLPAKEKRPKKSVLSRIGLSKRHLNDETKIRKSALESAARRDTPLERSQLELEQVRNTKPYMGDTPATVSSVDGRSSSTPKSKWSRLSPGSHKQMNKLSRHPGSISWPLPAQGGTSPRVSELSPDICGKESHNATTVSSSQAINRSHTSDGMNRRKPQSTPTDMPSDLDSNWTARFLHHRHHRKGTDSTLNSDASGGPSVGTTIILKDAKKKSRFPMLRRAFGLS